METSDTSALKGVHAQTIALACPEALSLMRGAIRSLAVLLASAHTAGIPSRASSTPGNHVRRMSSMSSMMPGLTSSLQVRLVDTS